MTWLRIIATMLLVVIGSISWLFAFNAPFFMFSQLGFCESAAEIPDCPAPLWYWLGNIIIPTVLTIAAVRKIRNILREHQNDQPE